MSVRITPRSSVPHGAYGSEEEGQIGSEDLVFSGSVTKTRSPRRKRGSSRIMNGLSLDNVIRLDDHESGISAAPVSSRRATTRGSIHGPAVALYDLKYHPMDDVISKARARAHRRRSLYARVLASEETSDENDDFPGLDENSNDTDNESGYARTVRLQRKGCRTSSRRRTGPKPLYDSRRHPADNAIQEYVRQQHRDVNARKRGLSSEPEPASTAKSVASSILNTTPPHVTFSSQSSSDSSSSASTNETKARDADGDSGTSANRREDSAPDDDRHSSPVATGVTDFDELDESDGSRNDFMDAMALHKVQSKQETSQLTSELDTHLLDDGDLETLVGAASDVPSVGSLHRNRKRRKTSHFTVYQDLAPHSEAGGKVRHAKPCQQNLDEPKENRLPQQLTEQRPGLSTWTAPIATMESGRDGNRQASSVYDGLHTLGLC